MVDFSDVAVVCTSRAEAGPLQSVIKELKGCSVCKVSYAYREDPHTAMGHALEAFSAAFYDNKPKLVVVLGDRYETLSAAFAAMFLKIPVAHIHGGETTTGSFDNALRHSISHIAKYHFVAAEEFKSKLIMLGANAEMIHVVGAPGLDGVQENSARRDRELLLVTYHPETMLPDNGVNQCLSMLNELSIYNKKHHVVFTGVNNDPGCEEIREMISGYVATHGNSEIRDDVTHDAYVELMQSASAVVGNSSAGIIEAPWIGIPTVNIGLRQSGRPLASSIHNTISDALAWRGFCSPIYKGGAAEKITNIIGKIYIK